MFRKQIRQIPNLRMYALGRPQIGHRLYALTLNLGVRFVFAIRDFLAKVASLKIPSLYGLNGMPIWASSVRASSSVLALVTMVIFMPLILSILS